MSSKADLREFPVGYWLWRADEALAGHVEHALRGHGFDPLHWLVLNLVYGMNDGTVSDHDMSRAKRTFVDARELDSLLNDLVRKGWLARLDATGGLMAPLGLTDAGREGRRTFLQTSTAVRNLSQSGINEDDCRTTVATLRRMVDNLERA